jgi:sporulation protein YlmC with PRC-barrel domain
MGEGRHNQLLGSPPAIDCCLGEKRKNFKQVKANLKDSEPKMEKNDKPLTRDALVSMQVIDAKGKLLGKVKDVAFAVGKMGIALTIENNAGETQNVAWEDVQAAADFIILKPQMVQQTAQTVAQPVQPAQQQSTQPICPTCSKPLTWIPQYQRWYCYNDKKYV